LEVLVGQRFHEGAFVQTAQVSGGRSPSCVWLYFRFNLSLRDVEEMLAERGIEVSYETVRCWTKKFGPQFASRLRKLRPLPSP
jgi:hypothetical protein